jgi:hypothetical protein
MSGNTNDQSPSAPGSGAPVKTVAISRRHSEGLVLILIAALAMTFIIGANGINSGSSDVVGPSTFPMAVSVLLLICVAAALIMLFRKSTDETITVKRPRALLVSMVLLAAFAPLVEQLGYYVLIVPWVLAFGWAARVRTPMLMGATLIVVLVLASGVFDALLGTPMP